MVISRKRDLRRGGEFALVRFVVRLQLGVGDLQLLEDLGLLHLLHEHRALELPPQIGHRHAFLLQRGLQRFVGFDLVFFLDVLDDAVEALGGHGVAELLAALDHQHFVDGVDDDAGRDFGQRLLQRLIVLGTEVRDRADEARRSAAASSSVLVMISPFTFTSTCSRIVGLRRRNGDRNEQQAGPDDVSSDVHVNHLLYRAPIPGPSAKAGAMAGAYDCRSSSRSVTFTKTPSGARGSSGACFRISAFVNPGVTSPVVARAVHQAGFRCIFGILAPF